LKLLVDRTWLLSSTVLCRALMQRSKRIPLPNSTPPSGTTSALQGLSQRSFAMLITNNAGLPDAIVAAVANDPYPHGQTGDISCTQLIGPPQPRILRKLHSDALQEDASDRIWSLLGQSVHTILERSERVALTEDRLFAHVNGWSVSGQYDRMCLLSESRTDPETGATSAVRILQDYKVTSCWAVQDGAKDDWTSQLNVLAWLARRNGYRVDQLQVVAILRDWSKGRARKGGSMPTKPVVVIDVPVWSERVASRYVSGRVKLHQEAERTGIMGDPLPLCSTEERWVRGEQWAVRKPGRKTALRVFDNQLQADAFAAENPGTYVEHRPGEPLRCMDYCEVASFCSQYQGELAASEAREAA
jgi:hypothetical protein